MDSTVDTLNLSGNQTGDAFFIEIRIQNEINSIVDEGEMVGEIADLTSLLDSDLLSFTREELSEMLRLTVDAQTRLTDANQHLTTLIDGHTRATVEASD